MAQDAEKIKREKQRVQDEISRLQSIVLEIEKHRYKGPHIENLRRLIELCFDALSSGMDTHLERVTAHLPLRYASDILTNLRTVIKNLVDFLYVIASHSEKVPRELYYLIDAFLVQHNVPTDNYVVSVSDEMAVTGFKHVLELNNMDIWFPSFWEKMKDVRFYFIHVLSDFVGKDSSLNWPIVLHEGAHIVCYEKGIDLKYLPKISILEALKATQKTVIPRKAQKKLYVSEYLADLLVTRCIGAIYGWRFLEMYGSYGDILAPGRSHPPPDRRILKISREIRNELLVFRSAAFLRKELRLRTKEWAARPTTRVPYVDVNYILRGLLGEARGYNRHALTYHQVKRGIFNSRWYQVLKENEVNMMKFTKKSLDKFLASLQEKLIEGVPIIVDPFVLYFIFTLDFAHPEKFMHIVESKDEQDRRVRELIADCIRLQAVQEQFFTDIKPINVSVQQRR